MRAKQSHSARRQTFLNNPKDSVEELEYVLVNKVKICKRHKRIFNNNEENLNTLFIYLYGSMSF